MIYASQNEVLASCQRFERLWTSSLHLLSRHLLEIIGQVIQQTHVRFTLCPWLFLINTFITKFNLIGNQKKTHLDLSQFSSLNYFISVILSESVRSIDMGTCFYFNCFGDARLSFKSQTIC